MDCVRAKIFVAGSTKSKSIRIPVALFGVFRWARRIVCLGLILLLLQVGTFFGYNHFLQKATQQHENLREKLAELSVESNRLNDKMVHYFEQEDLLHTKAGLPVMDHSVRELGTGGEVLPEDLFLRSVSQSAALIAEIRESTERLENKIALNQSSFMSLDNYIDRQQKNYRNIPSIAPAKGRYASAFGHRVHPVTGQIGKMHYGVDISNDPWTPIYAAADGVVQTAQLSSSFGNYVVLNHGNGFLTKYGHMTRYIVRPGQYVERYQVIGYMGNTGLSAGPHLHYEVWLNGDAVNPLAYILPNDHAIE